MPFSPDCAPTRSALHLTALSCLGQPALSVLGTIEIISRGFTSVGTPFALFSLKNADHLGCTVIAYGDAATDAIHLASAGAARCLLEPAGHPARAMELVSIEEIEDE